MDGLRANVEIHFFWKKKHCSTEVRSWWNVGNYRVCLSLGWPQTTITWHRFYQEPRSRPLWVGGRWRIHEVVGGVPRGRYKISSPVIQCVTARLVVNNGPHDAYHHFVTIADVINIESVYTLKCEVSNHITYATSWYKKIFFSLYISVKPPPIFNRERLIQ